MAKWIDVKKKLPKDGVPVIATYIGYCSRRYYCDMIAIHKNEDWFYYDSAIGDNVESCGVTITHWLPLPKLPKEVRNIDRKG